MIAGVGLSPDLDAVASDLDFAEGGSRKNILCVVNIGEAMYIQQCDPESYTGKSIRLLARLQ